MTTSQLTAAEWSQYMKEIDQAGQRVVARLPKDATESDKYDAYTMMIGALTSAYFTIVMSNPDHPELVQWLGLYQNILAPNADTLYLNTAIDGAGTYRLTGRTGGIPIMLLQVQGPSQMVTGAKVFAMADYELTDLPRDQEGRFELVLGAERPDGYTGEWRSLDPKAGLLMLRLVSDDWAGQEAPSIAIERIDIHARAMRRNVSDLHAKLKMLAPYIENTATRWIDHVTELRSSGIINTLKPKSYAFVGGVPTQSYYEGIFDFAPDEALILESDMPEKCDYWSIILTDAMFSTLDWSNNQSSLNRTQTRLDSDGRLRVVISHSDPGVPNWMDTVDRPWGVIQGRWAGCSSTPLPSIRKVKLAEVRKYLPADTAVISSEERDRSLRTRRESYQLRRKW